MTVRVKGAFDVKVTPHPPAATGLNVNRLTFNKTFHGDLAGTSVLEMLGLMLKELGSGGYVALEQFTGTLQGRSGTFYLQHSSTMTRGQPTQSITVIPDSGTGGLAGLSGSMTIDAAEGKHAYTFDFILS